MQWVKRYFLLLRVEAIACDLRIIKNKHWIIVVNCENILNPSDGLHTQKLYQQIIWKDQNQQYELLPMVQNHVFLFLQKSIFWKKSMQILSQKFI